MNPFLPLPLPSIALTSLKNISPDLKKTPAINANKKISHSNKLKGKYF